MSLVSKIQALISAANAKTGQSDADLTSAVQHLCDGYGSGGGSETGSIDTTNVDTGLFYIDNVGSDAAKRFTVETTKKCSNIVVVPTIKTSKNGTIMCLIYTDNVKICAYFLSSKINFAQIGEGGTTDARVVFENNSITFGCYGTAMRYFPTAGYVAWFAW